MPLRSAAPEILYKYRVGIVGWEGMWNSQFGTAYVSWGAHKELRSAHVTSYFDAEWKRGGG